jgi:hypothetical protein
MPHRASSLFSTMPSTTWTTSSRETGKSRFCRRTIGPDGEARQVRVFRLDAFAPPAYVKTAINLDEERRTLSDSRKAEACGLTAVKVNAFPTSRMGYSRGSEIQSGSAAGVRGAGICCLLSGEGRA